MKEKKVKVREESEERPSEMHFEKLDPKKFVEEMMGDPKSTPQFFIDGYASIPVHCVGEFSWEKVLKNVH